MNIYIIRRMGYFTQLDIEIQNQKLLHETVLTELIEFTRKKLKEEEELEHQLENYHQYLFDVARGK